MVNKVILIGDVGMDPEIRVLEGGTKVARLRIATTERIYNPATQERRDHTEWHTVTLWRGLAEVADRYVKKGSQVYVEGKIRSREWEDEATHTKRYAIEIVADNFNLLGRRDSNSSGGGGESSGQGYQGSGSQASSGPRPYVAPQQNSVPQQPDADPYGTSGDDADDLPF